MAEIKQKLKQGGELAERVRKWVEWSLIIGSAVVYLMGNQRYNAIKSEVKSTITITVSEAEAKFQQGKISKKDLDNIKIKAEDNNLHYGADIFNAIKNFNYSGILTSISDLGHTLMDPTKMDSKIGVVKEGYIQTLDERGKQLSSIDTALNELDRTNCSEESLQHYKSALEILTKLELPTQDYELKFDRINTKCTEINYFNDLSQKMVQATKDLKTQNLSANEIANELEIYFAANIRPVNEMSDLKARTIELSTILSKDLGYNLSLKNYLTTSQK